MDIKRKKELLMEYKNRHPEMGIIAMRCKDTGDIFFGISKDTEKAFNSICFKLDTSWHPNKKLQKLWNEYGEAGFDRSVEKVLKYEDPLEDHTEELEELLELCLEEQERAERL